MVDKIPAAIVILTGTVIVAVIAGWNNNLGKFLFAFMLIVAMVWLIGGGTQSELAKWAGIAKSGTSTPSKVTLV
jgi:hypothetical protein